MNIGAVFGVLFAIAITAFTIMTSAKSPAVFSDSHAIVIVIGGTITVALLSFPIPKLWVAMKIVMRKVFGKKKNNYLSLIKNIVDTATIYRTNPKESLEKMDVDAHPFFKDGMKYLVDYGFSFEEIDEVLTNALNGKKKRDDQEVKVWHTISRFPPAFGLLGATVGMIALLQTLGEPGAQDRVGPAMATALVATFYGLIFANLILIPLSENLSEVASDDLVTRKIIKEGVLLIQEKKHPLYIEEYLKSFLPPGQRMTEIEEEVDQKNAA